MEQMDNQNATISQYAGGPVQLSAVLNGLTDSDLDLALTTDTWTIRQIVHHIVDGDDMWKTCIWAANWKYTNRPIQPSIELLRANRQHMAELIQKTPNAWELSIRIKHPEIEEEQRLTIGFVLEMQTGHMTEHIGEIQAIRLRHNL